MYNFVYFQVLRVWRNKANPTVNEFVQKIQTWQTSGFLNSDVWGTLRNFVDPDLLPVEVPSSAPSVDSDESDDSTPIKKRRLNKRGKVA